MEFDRDPLFGRTDFAKDPEQASTSQLGAPINDLPASLLGTPSEQGEAVTLPQSARVEHEVQMAPLPEPGHQQGQTHENAQVNAQGHTQGHAPSFSNRVHDLPTEDIPHEQSLQPEPESAAYKGPSIVTPDAKAGLTSGVKTNGMKTNGMKASASFGTQSAERRSRTPKAATLSGSFAPNPAMRQPDSKAQRRSTMGWRPTVAVAGVCMISLIAVGYALNRNSTITTGGDIPVLYPPAAQERTAPSEPGGLEIPGRGLTVLDGHELYADRPSLAKSPEAVKPVKLDMLEQSTKQASIASQSGQSQDSIADLLRQNDVAAPTAQASQNPYAGLQIPQFDRNGVAIPGTVNNDNNAIADPIGSLIEGWNDSKAPAPIGSTLDPQAVAALRQVFSPNDVSVELGYAMPAYMVKVAQLNVPDINTQPVIGGGNAPLPPLVNQLEQELQAIENGQLAPNGLPLPPPNVPGGLPGGDPFAQQPNGFPPPADPFAQQPNGFPPPADPFAQQPNGFPPQGDPFAQGAPEGFPAPDPFAAPPQPIQPPQPSPQQLQQQAEFDRLRTTAHSDAPPIDSPFGGANIPHLPDRPRLPTSLAIRPYGIQVASMRKRSEAVKYWGRLQKKYPELLGDMVMDVERAKVRGKTYYRVQAGPIPNRITAIDLCGILKRSGLDCIPVKRK